MNRWINNLCMVGLVLCPASKALAWCNSCGGDGSCCRCPSGQAQCLYGHASCEEACGLTASPSGGLPSANSELAKTLGTALGKAIADSIRGNPEEDAKRQAEQAKAIEQQRQADELRRAEEMHQQELARQRILGLLKEAEPSTGLSLKLGDSDSTLTVGQTRGAFGSTEIKPTGIDSPPAENGLQLKLGDDADRSSMQAGKGFDTAGKIIGSDLPPPPRSPTSKSTANKSQLLNALKSKLKKNEAEEQSLKNQLAQLQKAPTPDPVAISHVHEKIVVKEKEKEKIMLDLTAEDPDAQGSNQATQH